MQGNSKLSTSEGFEARLEKHINRQRGDGLTLHIPEDVDRIIAELLELREENNRLRETVRKQWLYGGRNVRVEDVRTIHHTKR